MGLAEPKTKTHGHSSKYQPTQTQRTIKLETQLKTINIHEAETRRSEEHHQVNQQVRRINLQMGKQNPHLVPENIVHFH
jgi:hypothetical protein